MKNKNVYYSLLFLLIGLIQFSLLFPSCSNPQPIQPLKNTQIYGSDAHLPTREILSYQPDSTWIALISPSIKPLAQTFFKLNHLLKGEVIRGIKTDPILSKIIGEDAITTSNNIENAGIEADKPCGFFYNILNGKWELVGKYKDKEKVLGIFPSIKKSYLNTAWHSFITRAYPYYYDNLTNVGIYFSEDNKVFISNDTEAITKSVLPKIDPPSFNYGLNKKGILSDNEVALLFTSSDKLLNNIQDIKSTEIKALLTALNTHCEDFGFVLNPTDEKTEIAFVFYTKNGINEPSITPLTSKLILDGNLVIQGTLYLQSGLLEFITTLNKNDNGGIFRRVFGPATGALSQKLICDELSFGVYENNGEIGDFIVATRSNNLPTLTNILRIVTEDSEPIGNLSTLKLNKQSPLVSNIPIDFIIGYKDPLFIVASSIELLQQIEPRIAEATTKCENISNCKLGYIKINKEKISQLLESLKVKDENLYTIKEILPKMSDICINYNSNWGIININLEL